MAQWRSDIKPSALDYKHAKPTNDISNKHPPCALFLPALYFPHAALYHLTHPARDSAHRITRQPDTTPPMSAAFTILPLTPITLAPSRNVGGLAEQTEDTTPTVEQPAWMHSAVTLSANGHSLMQISSSLQKDVRAVSKVLQSDWAKVEVARLITDGFSGAEESKTIKNAAMDAVTTLQELMVTAPPAVRLAAAREILDRALGKPMQKVQHSGTNAKLDVREEMEMLRKELKLS